MQAPFPYFGGKSHVAETVWAHFGEVRNYIEPFCGSMAVLLHQMQGPDYEIVNDVDGLLTNFWRAIKYDPEGVADLAQAPATEIDQMARHNWVFKHKEMITEMQADPEYYDVKAAAYWVYVRSTMVGGRGIFQEHVGSRVTTLGSRRGIFANSRRDQLVDLFQALSKRLQRVQICSGDWKRVLTKSPLHPKPTAIFFDPPYPQGEFYEEVYEHSGKSVFEQVRQWCLDHGDDPNLRIALCGYEGIGMPDTWECLAWKTCGGYGKISSEGRGMDNRTRERIWFSPHCHRPTVAAAEISFGDLFG